MFGRSPLFLRGDILFSFILSNTAQESVRDAMMAEAICISPSVVRSLNWAGDCSRRTGSPVR